jgi:glycosyltransferase involved in cell wall biosynthesis
MDLKVRSISIGIFAHNEESNIQSTLDSLSSQDVFFLPQFSNTEIKVSVLANGCTDNTVEIASSYLKTQTCFNGQVIEIEKAGKSYTWNQFIHRAEFFDTEYFICMDSDIHFGSDAVISKLVQRLSYDENAYLAVDIAKKDTELKLHKTVFERISLLFSSFMRQGSTAVAGSLYCGKGEKLRRVHMPDGLPVEDGFLRAMLVTDLFREKDNQKRVLVVDDVCHYFTPDSSLRALFRHEERLLIGTFINSVIYGYLWKEVPRSGIDAGILIEKRNKANPRWVMTLIEDYKASHKKLIPVRFYFKYFNKLKNLGPFKAVILFPIVFFATVVRTILLIKIQRKLATISGVGYW